MERQSYYALLSYAGCYAMQLNLKLFIMVIELGGVHFGQKVRVRFQTKIPEVQFPLYYIHFEIAQVYSLNTRTTKVAKFAKQWPFRLSFSYSVIG